MSDASSDTESAEGKRTDSGALKSFIAGGVGGVAAVLVGEYHDRVSPSQIIIIHCRPSV